MDPFRPRASVFGAREDIVTCGGNAAPLLRWSDGVSPSLVLM